MPAFLATDPEELVAAAFACPVCLGEADRVAVTEDDEGALAQCFCEHCERDYEVALDPWQALRVLLT